MPSPFDKATRHAQDTARHGGTISECAYRDKVWRQAWLKAFEKAQQQELFEKGEDDE